VEKVYTINPLKPIMFVTLEVSKVKVKTFLLI